MFFAIHPDLSNIPAAYLPTSSHNIYDPKIIIVIVEVLVSPSLVDLNFLNQEMFYQLLLQSIKANYASA